MTTMENNPGLGGGDRTVSVILPTTCDPNRTEFLHRAIASVVSQTGVVIDALIVVNGDRHDPRAVAALEQDPRLGVLRLEEGNVSAARYAGVCHAKGQYFCFLDDDDELLPNALSCRLATFAKHNDADVIVTNGFLYVGRDTANVDPGRAAAINDDPAGSLLDGNWFASPASLFRASTVEPTLFDFRYKHFEWTYLFFLLLLKGKKIHFDDCYTYRIYNDNPHSISKTLEYVRAYPELLLRLEQLALPLHITKIVRSKYAPALNAVSNIERTQGSLRRAWSSHAKCLANGGWRYLPYTRHLVRETLRLKL